MQTSHAGRSNAPLLQLAHICLSGALQFDYLSNGIAHRHSTRVSATRPTSSSEIRNLRPAQAGTNARRGHRHDLIRHYLYEISTRPRLTSSEEYRLACATRRGDRQARQRLIEDQLGLVVVIARRYRSRGLPMLDLIAEGNLGLMAAISKFDPERGYRLSTYAKWWVRQSIELALMTQVGIVHVPVHVRRELKRRARNSDAAKSGTVSALDNPARLLLYDVRNQAEAPHGSSEAPPLAIIDTVEAPEDDQPEWSLSLTSRRAYLEKALLKLTHTEQLIIRARFGLDEDTTRTLDSLAQQLGLSCERVRQIQGLALHKLRQVFSEDRTGDGELL